MAKRKHSVTGRMKDGGSEPSTVKKWRKMDNMFWVEGVIVPCEAAPKEKSSHDLYLLAGAGIWGSDSTKDRVGQTDLAPPGATGSVGDILWL